MAYCLRSAKQSRGEDKLRLETGSFCSRWVSRPSRRSRSAASAKDQLLKGSTVKEAAFASSYKSLAQFITMSAGSPDNCLQKSPALAQASRSMAADRKPSRFSSCLIDVRGRHATTIRIAVWQG